MEKRAFRLPGFLVLLVVLLVIAAGIVVSVQGQDLPKDQADLRTVS